MNVYLEKISENSEGYAKYLELKNKKQEQRKQTAKDASVGAVGVSGALLAKSQYDRGNLTGRETLYHGTSSERADSIRKEGLRPNAKPGVSVALSQELEDKNKGLVFTAKNRRDSVMYSAQQKTLDKTKGDLIQARFNPKNVANTLKEVVKTHATGEGVVKMNVPTWKKKYHGVDNPEIPLAMEKVRQAFGTKGFAHDVHQYALDKNLKEGVHVMKGEVPPRYIKGSDTYKKLGSNEFKSFVKQNPVRFSKGVGKAMLGAAAVTSSIGYAVKRNGE